MVMPAMLTRIHLAFATMLLAAAIQAQPVYGQSRPATFEAAFADLGDPRLTLEPQAGAVDIRRLGLIGAQGAKVLRELGSGIASYYGKQFHGRKTANGERFDMNNFTAAHRTLPFGSMVRVTNPRNGRSVVVRINDRGPFVRGRVIDLSRAAAEQIGLIARGHGQVELALIAS